MSRDAIAFEVTLTRSGTEAHRVARGAVELRYRHFDISSAYFSVRISLVWLQDV